MRPAIVLTAALPLLALGACELAPKSTTQNGFRGTGMNQIYVNADMEVADVPAPPYELPEDTGGPRASEVYENVQVLGNVSADEFNYIMAAITEWVSPEQGCNYCHNPANMASDEVYTKVVARKMLQMTQKVNADWQPHVADTGVTCWTCHRGNPIPEAYWTNTSASRSRGAAQVKRGDNTPIAMTAYASLPATFAEQFLANPADAVKIALGTDSMHPAGNTKTTMDAEPVYSLMNHMSTSLGVNCTFCHNTQNFKSWKNSTPQRATAWHGIRMVGDLNKDYITTLKDVFPANRLGAEGDPFKVNCTTCHQGQNKPMGGAKMAKDYPSLLQGVMGPDTVEAMAVMPAVTAAEE